MREPFPYDVFLSHNQADKPRVRRLAERLRAVGGRAPALWFDEWVIQPGGSPRPSDGVRGEGLAIERGLEASRTLVLCLSPAALGSDWVGLERSTVLFRDPANAGRCFIPFFHADYEPGRTPPSVSHASKWAAQTMSWLSFLRRGLLDAPRRNRRRPNLKTYAMHT